MKEYLDNQDKNTIELMPLVDITEDADGVEMTFEVPGANAETVAIEVAENVMKLEAQSSLKRSGRQIVFKRSFRLGDGVDASKIKANTKDGVLTLAIPKSDFAKVHRIKVENA